MPPTPGCSLLPAPAREKTLFLLGGYTDKSVLAHAPAGGEGDGFYSVMFDPEQAQLSKVSAFKVTGCQCQVLHCFYIDIPMFVLCM